MKISSDSKLVFMGDSITDCGRDLTGNPTPWNLNAGLGRGFVDLVAAHFGVVCPERKIRVINRGVSGNTVVDLASRWEVDVLRVQPDWLVVMIGINDVWRQFDQPLVTEAHVTPEVYERVLDDLLQRTPVSGGRMLMTPFMVEPNRDEPMRRRMDDYGRIVQRLAERHGTLFVDTQKAFDAVLTTTHPMALAWDRIHPNSTGHLILARAFLSAIEAPGLG